MQNNFSNHIRDLSERGTGMFEYSLVAYPRGEVYDQLVKEQEGLSVFYGDIKHSRVTPSVTVSQFFAKDEMEETIIRWLQRIIGDQRAFSVTLNNYGGFPPDTVFLRVQDPLPFRYLAQQLEPIDGYIRGNSCPPVHFNMFPRVSISEKLPASVYARAITDYAQRLFHGSFAVSELALIRRSDSGDSFRQVAILRLQPDNNFFKN